MQHVIQASFLLKYSLESIISKLASVKLTKSTMVNFNIQELETTKWKYLKYFFGSTYVFFFSMNAFSS